MAIPTEKSKAINDLCREVMGKDRMETIIADKCMSCTGDATKFTDELSKREYKISGLCQKCQDSAFGCRAF